MSEVFRRVGRNLLLFQHIELLLKALLSGSGIAGYASEIQAKAARRAEEISGKTLGQLAQQYHDEVLGQSDPEVVAPAELREPWLSFRFRREADKAVVDRDRAVLDALVTERNELAHRFLTRWNLSEAAEIDEAIRYLDAQRERALPVFEHMKSILGELERGRKEVAEAMTNGEVVRQLKLRGFSRVGSSNSSGKSPKRGLGLTAGPIWRPPGVWCTSAPTTPPWASRSGTGSSR